MRCGKSGLAKNHRPKAMASQKLKCCSAVEGTKPPAQQVTILRKAKHSYTTRLCWKNDMTKQGRKACSNQNTLVDFAVNGRVGDGHVKTWILQLHCSHGWYLLTPTEKLVDPNLLKAAEDMRYESMTLKFAAIINLSQTRHLLNFIGIRPCPSAHHHHVHPTIAVQWAANMPKASDSAARLPGLRKLLCCNFPLGGFRRETWR